MAIGKIMHRVTLCLLFFSSAAFSTCYRITTVNTNTSSAYYTGANAIAKNWAGANDAAGSIGSMANTININNDDFQPDGSLIATGIVPFVGAEGEYPAEQILYRCQPTDGDLLYELYATNGDNDYAGRYAIENSYGIVDAYQTVVPKLVIQVTNLSTNETYSKFWKQRKLENVDVDEFGWYQVKAKNFSQSRVNLYKLSNSKGNSSWTTYTGVYNYSQPSSYIVFKGPGLGTNNIKPGDNSDYVHPNFHSNWPAAVNLYNRLYIRRSATCKVNNITPFIMFPTASVQSMMEGNGVSRNFSVDFQCQLSAPASTGQKDPFVSGTSAGQSAIGFLINQFNIAKAQQLNLNNASGGISYLLSDGYGTDTSIASGVGVQISDSAGNPMNFLSNLNSNSGNAAAAGWYPVLSSAIEQQQNNGYGYYRASYIATFKRVPGLQVTPGNYKASAQVVIQVQ